MARSPEIEGDVDLVKEGCLSSGAKGEDRPKRAGEEREGWFFQVRENLGIERGQ